MLRIIFIVVFYVIFMQLETPKFSQLRILYPGYPEYGGHYHQQRLLRIILGQEAVDDPTYAVRGVDDGESSSPLSASAVLQARHHSAAVRLSYTLNRYGGRHAVGTVPVQLTHYSSTPVDSFTGVNGQQYIFRNEAFGPFLAERYGNPEVVWTAVGDVNSVNKRKSSPSSPMSAFVGRQGIVRIVSFRRHSENGHVALWDCNRFHQSRDWSTGSHVISIEFWESAGKYIYIYIYMCQKQPFLQLCSDCVIRYFACGNGLSIAAYIWRRCITL